MPKQIDIKHGVKLDTYVYLCSNNVTYEKGAKLFGFNSKQAFHAWVHSKTEGTRDEQVKRKLAEISK